MKIYQIGFTGSNCSSWVQVVEYCDEFELFLFCSLYRKVFTTEVTSNYFCWSEQPRVWGPQTGLLMGIGSGTIPRRLIESSSDCHESTWEKTRETLQEENLCKSITIAIGVKKRLQTTACFTSNWLKFFGGLKFKNFRSVEDSNVLIVSKSIFQMNTKFTVQSVFHIQFLSFEMMEFAKNEIFQKLFCFI